MAPPKTPKPGKKRPMSGVAASRKEAVDFFQTQVASHQENMEPHRGVPLKTHGPNWDPPRTAGMRVDGRVDKRSLLPQSTFLVPKAGEEVSG